MNRHTNEVIKQQSIIQIFWGRMLQAQKISRREVGVGLLCSKKTKKSRLSAAREARKP